ncbi:hypothetical protein L3X38_036861 [Prunus dulcis]|uniref:Tf2-1-like SH3-like domain-containing protein n=1 Tax=Prunus dulcis TaxID=3755 RepID=A0AAD4YQ51_PRUDU|nr:hypothetical protein L3X38_036861 [Prunus dulcis]
MHQSCGGSGSDGVELVVEMKAELVVVVVVVIGMALWRKIHTEVEAQLQCSQQRYKAFHDKHRVLYNFKEGDPVWLHLGKERLMGEGKKLKPIRYGPFKIVKQMSDNGFQLELPPYMHMHSIINAKNLKLFEPSLLDNDPDEDNRLPSVDDLKIEREDPLHEDCIL